MVSDPFLQPPDSQPASLTLLPAFLPGLKVPALSASPGQERL